MKPRRHNYGRYVKGDSELALHMAVVQFLRMKYPRVMFDHNGAGIGAKTEYTRWLTTVMGVHSGVPDLMIYETDRHGHTGLAIELKVGRNKSTDNQIVWQNHLRNQGWLIYELKDYDEVMKVIDEYFSN